jgi:tRNA G18 (ribose-2'-O)-methylase SpoU
MRAQKQAMPQLIPITDPDDPRIEAFRQVRERDLVGRDGGFIAEGEVVLRQALQAGRHAITSVLMTEGRLAAQQPLLDLLPRDAAVYLAPQAVMNTVVGFDIHRGILAFGRQAPPPALPDLLAALPERALLLVLVGIANHDNMGGILRNAAAFGATAVILDATCCDPFYRKAIRVSVGAALSIPLIRAPDLGQALSALAAAGFELVGLSPAGETTLKALDPSPRTALVLGAEGPGLPADVLAATRTVRVEMTGQLDSLNVATTCGIVLHHLAG